MSLGRRLKELREARGITRKQLANELGVTPGSIAHYETDVSVPSMDILFSTAEILGCDMNYLFQDSITVEPITFTTTLEEQDIIKKLRNLTPEDKKLAVKLIDELFKRKVDLELYISDRAIELPVLASSAYPEGFRLATVVGDSAEPLFSDGDVLIVRPTELLKPGQTGLFEYRGRVIVRRFEEGELQAINEKYGKIKINKRNKVKVLGEVKGKV